MVDAKQLLEKYEPKPVKVLEPDRQMFVTRFSPCGKYLLAGSFDGLVHRWDVSGEEMIELEPVAGHGGWIETLEFAPDEKTVVSADSWGQVRCWHYADENPQPKWSNETAHDGWIHSLTISTDGQYVATGAQDKMVRVWSLTDGKLHCELSGHAEPVFRVLFHPDGNSLVSGDLKGVVKHWDLQKAACVRDLDASALYELHRLQDCGGVRAFAFDSKGQTLLVGGLKPSNGGTVRGTPTVLIFNWADGKQQKDVTVAAVNECFVHDLYLHADGFFMAVTSGTPGAGRLHFMRAEDEKPFFTAAKMENCHSLAVHPDGYRLAVAATSRGSNGNGRRLDKDGNYLGNSSPIHLLDMPRPTAVEAPPVEQAG